MIAFKKKINEEAKSKSQQRFFGMVRAYQKGDLKKSDVSQEVIDAAKSMKKKDVKDFAETKHKGLPNHVKKTSKKELKENAIREYIHNSLNNLIEEQKLRNTIKKFINESFEEESKRHLLRLVNWFYTSITALESPKSFEMQVKLAQDFLVKSRFILSQEAVKTIYTLLEQAIKAVYEKKIETVKNILNTAQKRLKYEMDAQGIDINKLSQEYRSKI